MEALKLICQAIGAVSLLIAFGLFAWVAAMESLYRRSGRDQRRLR